jgi:hypothetical protein
LQAHAEVYSALRAKGVKFKVTKEFNAPGLFTGASINVNDADGLAALANTPGVVSVRPVQYFSHPKPVKTTVVKSPKDAAVPQGMCKSSIAKPS